MHNPNNEECEAACDSECNKDHTHFDENDCTCPPEQKEEVVHASGCAADLDGCYDGSCLSIPEQKEEKATPSTKILTGLQFHRNDCPVRFVNCICNFNADEVLDEVKKMVKEEPRTPKAICQLCKQPMPEGEEMFNYHGYSGNCPKVETPISEKTLREKFQEHVEQQVWQGEDEYTKNMPVGNVADWFLAQFDMMLADDIENAKEIFRIADEREDRVEETDITSILEARRLFIKK